ncbi:MAG: hypothetical protein J5884_04725 [Paludibacteraceae bacterium]|nr:hypothetical protein [Paludibacteraceae bacterium]
MKRRTLKHLIPVFLMGIIAIFVSCGEAVDQRDAYVGVYDFEAKGNLDFYYMGVSVMSMPLDETGTFTISKIGDKDKIAIVGYNDTIYATVSGKQLTLEATTYSFHDSGVDMEVTFTYDKAKLNKNQLTWETDVYATATYNGINAKGEGEVSMVATKKETE